MPRTTCKPNLSHIRRAHPPITPYRQGFLDFHNAQVYENTFMGNEAQQYDQGNADARRQFCRSHEVRHRDRCSGAIIITNHYSPQDARIEASWRRFNGHPDAEVVYVG